MGFSEKNKKIYHGLQRPLEVSGYMSVSPTQQLTASDWRVLLAHWYYNACVKALQGEAKRKYFEHSGAPLTADGTDDDKIDQV